MDYPGSGRIRYGKIGQMTDADSAECAVPMNAGTTGVQAILALNDAANTSPLGAKGICERLSSWPAPS